MMVDQRPGVANSNSGVDNGNTCLETGCSGVDRSNPWIFTMVTSELSILNTQDWLPDGACAIIAKLLHMPPRLLRAGNHSDLLVDIPAWPATSVCVNMYALAHALASQLLTVPAPAWRRALLIRATQNCSDLLTVAHSCSLLSELLTAVQSCCSQLLRDVQSIRAVHQSCSELLAGSWQLLAVGS